MKALVSVVMLLSISHPHIPLPARTPVDSVVVQHAHKGGRWYFAESGHAVYCLGPVRMMPEATGGIQRVATFCEGDRPMVPLKD
jgi:hypothetical protein